MSHFLMIFCLSLLVVTFAVREAEGLQVTCNTNSMQIDLPRKLFHEMRDEHLRLIDPECGAQSNKSFFSLSTSHTSCGTTSQVIGGYIVYSNEVMEMPNKNSAVITTVGEKEVQVPFSCYYLKREIVTAVGFRPRPNKLYVSVKGRGNYKLNLNFYRNSYKSRGAPVNADVPVSVKLRERLYFEASLDTHEKDLQVFASNCCSSPTSDHEAFPKFRHALIVEGCAVDPSVEFHDSSSPTVQRFSIRAFKFLGGHPFVFIHCRIYVCDVKDNSSRCAQGCKKPEGGGQARRDERHKEGADEKQSAPEKLHADKKQIKMAAHHEQKKETKSAAHPMQKKSSNVKANPLQKNEKKVYSPLANTKEKKTVHPVKKKESKKEPAVTPAEKEAKKDESETKDVQQMLDDLLSHVTKRDVSHVKKDTTSGFAEISKGPFVVSDKRRVKSRNNDGQAAKAKKNEIRADVKEGETKTGSSVPMSASDAVLVVMTVASVMALVGVIYLGRQAAKRSNPYEYTPLTVKTN